MSNCTHPKARYIKSDRINKLTFEGFAVNNKEMKRHVLRCAKCGQYFTKTRRPKEYSIKKIFPDDEEVKMARQEL